MSWIKGLGFFASALAIGVMALSLTLVLPIIAFLTTIICIVAIAAWLGQQYAEYDKENKAK